MRALIPAMLLSASAAWGYSAPQLFDVGPSGDTTGGAAGIYYTGSPRFQGQGCAGCHQGGDDRVSIRFTSAPDLSDRYAPGEVHHIEVDLLKDQVGPARCDDVAVPCNLNLFAVEVLDAGGATAGALCPVPFEGQTCAAPLGAPTVVSRDGTTLFASGLGIGASGPFFRDRETAYDFYWRAPASDVGPVDFWISAVDGDGALADPALAHDLKNDLTGTFRIRACATGPCGIAEGAADGCESTPAPGLIIFTLIALPMLRRRRR